MPTPSFPQYRKNALRPNPETAKPDRGDLAYAKGPTLTGDFGDEGASVRPALGLPATTPPQPKNQVDDTEIGWL